MITNTAFEIHAQVCCYLLAKFDHRPALAIGIKCIIVSLCMQLLQPLCQLANVLTCSRRLVSSRRGGNHRQASSDVGGAIAFRDSFEAALKSFASLVDAQYVDVAALATCNRWVAGDYTRRCLDRPRLPWLVRHSSTWSFEDNKRLLFCEYAGNLM